MQRLGEEYKGRHHLIRRDNDIIAIERSILQSQTLAQPERWLAVQTYQVHYALHTYTTICFDVRRASPHAFCKAKYGKRDATRTLASKPVSSSLVAWFETANLWLQPHQSHIPPN